MFKRVEKRLAKKREEEELGITEEIKEAVGLNGLDSDDSTSDESEASSSSSTPQVPSKRKRPFEEELDDGSDSAFGGCSSSASADEFDEDEPDVQMTVEEVLHNPLFITSIQPDIRGCVVCPRKVLKNDTMVSVHTMSQAHRRRMSKFKEVAASAKQDDDAREILSAAFASAPLSQKSLPSNDSASLSKRAVRRIAKFEKMKAKRQKHKAAKARSIAARTAKKLQTKVETEPETSHGAPLVDPPKNRVKLSRSSSRNAPNKRPPTAKQRPLNIPGESGSKGRGRLPKEQKLTDVRTNSRSKLVELRKKRKELAYVIVAFLASRHDSAMGISQHLRRLVSNLSEKNYEQMVSDYRFWMKIGLTHGWTSDDELDSYIQENIKPGPTQQLIHPTSHFLLQFVTDVSFDPVSSTHTRLCHSSLYRFFANNLDFSSRSYLQDHQLSEFYTNVNFLAHWVNLGYLGVEDVRDHLLQSLTFQHSPLDYQVNSLLILLKIAGATFAAYVDPPVINHCLNIIKSKSGPHGTLIKDVIKLSESGWEGLPPPPILPTAEPEKSISKPQDPAATPVATSLGLPAVGELPQTPTPPSPTLGRSSDESTRSSAPLSPSTSISGLSDFTIADSLDGEPTVEPETITPHDTFYLEDGSVEVACGMTLFRVHSSILSFHSPVLRQMFSSANLATAESPNGCPRVASSDTPTEFAILLRTIYLPGFSEKSKVPDFSTLSSLLKVSTKYEMPDLRAQVLETLRDVYPENFQGLDPSKTLAENVLSEPEPHPNAVLNGGVAQAYQRVFHRATRILQALSADDFTGDEEPKFCQSCRERMEVAHMDVRRKAWAELPRMFGPKA